MAVEKAKVIARIKAKYPKTNLSQKRMDEISDRLAQEPEDDADDDAIDVVVERFNSMVSFEDLAKIDDKKRSDAKRAKEAGGKKKSKADDSDDDDDLNEEEEDIDPDTPAWAKKMIETNRRLEQEVKSIKAGKQTETRLSQATEAFSKSELLKGLKPDIQKRWLSRVDLESETSFEDQIKDLEGEYSELVQANADGTPLGGAAGAGTPVEVSQKDVDEVLDNMRI